MKSKDEILAPLYYADSLKPALLYNNTIRSYFDKIIRSSNEKNIPKSISLFEQWDSGIIKEGIYAYYSGPTLRNDGTGRNDWGIVVIQKRKEGFFYATYGKLLKIINGQSQKRGKDFININKKNKFMSQYNYVQNNGQDYVNTAKLDNWSNFKQISVDEMSVMALNSRRVVNIHKPLKLGKMMNWGTLESFRE
jgi:hypothetical protein